MVVGKWLSLVSVGTRYCDALARAEIGIHFSSLNDAFEMQKKFPKLKEKQPTYINKYHMRNITVRRFSTGAVHQSCKLRVQGSIP